MASFTSGKIDASNSSDVTWGAMSKPKVVIITPFKAVFLLPLLLLFWPVTGFTAGGLKNSTNWTSLGFSFLYNIGPDLSLAVYSNPLSLAASISFCFVNLLTGTANILVSFNLSIATKEAILALGRTAWLNIVLTNPPTNLPFPSTSK